MLEIGQRYYIETANIFAVPIAKVSEGRHIFVSQRYIHNPFVSWGHSEPEGLNINCYHGNYYATLIEAMEGEGLVASSHKGG